MPKPLNVVAKKKRKVHPNQQPRSQAIVYSTLRKKIYITTLGMILPWLGSRVGRNFVYVQQVLLLSWQGVSPSSVCPLHASTKVVR